MALLLRGDAAGAVDPRAMRVEAIECVLFDLDGRSSIRSHP
jgi:hypothetical protein